ncbi:hypothetical protein CAEBREN_13025 [Caenorhabditis brenneri]|uniref:DUF38 domain-containing protein n=1 Tax=Caenorhabditis brenneri TaxID=135651 RepID=G0NF41_CAEBE|nr:hypothetical protein CAEBREN_13025 [Caenorhabditis brenneri]
MNRDSAFLSLRNAEGYRSINYVSSENGTKCIVKLDKTEKAVFNEDFKNVFLRELDKILQFQKTTLKCFEWKWEDCGGFTERNREERMEEIKQFLENLETLLKNHQHPVEELILNAQNLEEIMSVLPFINPRKLRKITIFNSFGNRNTLNFDDVVKLNQWKNANEVAISSLYLVAPIENFTHLSRILATFPSICTRDLNVLKEAFLLSRTPIFYMFHFPDFDDRANILNIWGPASIEKDDYWSKKYEYFFAIPDSYEILHVDIITFYAYFYRKNRKDIPENVIIQ